MQGTYLVIALSFARVKEVSYTAARAKICEILRNLYIKYVFIRESGFGRYNVMIEPQDKNRDAMILEFKVYNVRKEKTLEDTVQAALVQIEEKQYEASLIANGISSDS